MDFDSPDVEKEFPGLYASESGRKSNESDFSDDGEKISKKELLKRKEKKDRKDRGYATLEGESSPDEDQETKSPSKSKKTKAFKFPSKKEKREKSREKDGKERDTAKERKKKDKEDKDIDKEKRRDKDKDKTRQKLKDRKKGKHGGEDGPDIGDEQPIFGVSLQDAVERSRCHDGIDIPLVVRDCIDYVEEQGMSVEGLYKVPGVKSKIQYLRKLYNQREAVTISEFEPTVATGLLVLFLRELPEPILESSEMIARFEQAASAKEVTQRETQLAQLTQQLPNCNRILLAWIILHLDHVTVHEKTTKMNAQAIAMTLSPVLQMSHRLLLALLLHCKALFPSVQLTKYCPPLPAGSPSLPETAEGIAAELAKQESLLSQIHMQMNAGFVTKSREEQLWEVQRIITQLKRKYKTVQKLECPSQKSLDEEVKPSDDSQKVQQKSSVVSDEDPSSSKLTSLPTSVASSTVESPPQVMSEPKDLPQVNVGVAESETRESSEEKSVVDGPAVTAIVSPADETANIGAAQVTQNSTELPSDVEDEERRQRLIYGELLLWQASLNAQIARERKEIKQLTELLAERGQERPRPRERTHTPDEAEMAAMIQLVRENQLLEKKKATLVHSIIEEKDACVELRVQLALHELVTPETVRDIKQI